MEFNIDQILLMQDIIVDVRRRTQELTISEIVSREIDPVLKWGSPSQFINQPRSSRQRLRTHHKGAAIYSPTHNGTISLKRSNVKLSRDLRS